MRLVSLSLTHPLTRSLARSPARPPTHTHTHTHARTHTHTHPLTHPLTHSLTHLLTHNHWLTHSIICSCTRPLTIPQFTIMFHFLQGLLNGLPYLALHDKWLLEYHVTTKIKVVVLGFRLTLHLVCWKSYRHPHTITRTWTTSS